MPPPKKPEFTQLISFFNNLNKYSSTPTLPPPITTEPTQQTQQQTQQTQTQQTQQQSSRSLLQKQITLSPSSSPRFKRLSALNEIITTEEKYVLDLQLLLSFHTSLTDPQTLRQLNLKERDISLIFGEIPQILPVHSFILRELKTAADNGKSIEKIFTHSSAVFKVSQSYVNNFDKITEINAS